MSKNTTTSSAARGQAREALRRRQQQQAAAEKRLRTMVRTAWIAGITVIALIIGLMVWAVAGARSDTAARPVVTGNAVAPAYSTPAGAVRFGKPDAKVTVAVYADFMCPFCGRFERANGESLQRQVDAGTVQLEIHPMAFLDEMSAGTRYSTRAANAFVTVANADPGAALRFNQLLFAGQPAERSAGLSDQQIAALATRAGASAEVVASFAQQTYAPWIAQLTQQAFDAGVTGTPTVKINGRTFTGDLYTPGVLDAAIRQANA